MKKTIRNLAVALASVLALGIMSCQPNVEQHVHTYLGSWSSDESGHWNVCSECGKKVESAHSFVHKGNCWKRCSVCDKESTTPASLEALGAYTDLGSGKYTFGVYPQTIKSSSVTVDKGVKNTEITGGDYYLGSDGAWYAECIENGHETGSQYKYSDGSSVSKKNTSSPKVLYFKVEPVEWTKLSTTGCLVATKILTANVTYYPYDSVNRTIGGATVNPNNYQHSRVRAFLNGLSYEEKPSAFDDQSSNSDFNGKGFLQAAFTKKLQSKIKTTAVDNSEASTGYSSNSYKCGDTSDKVFLLSYKEAYNDNGLDNSSRIRNPTDYALANNSYKDNGSSYGGWWWLRSPRCDNSSSARIVSQSGADTDYYVCLSYGGIVPALSISK